MDSTIKSARGELSARTKPEATSNVQFIKQEQGTVGLNQSAAQDVEQKPINQVDSAKDYRR